jgi:hypothetical protein
MDLLDNLHLVMVMFQKERKTFLRLVLMIQHGMKDGILETIGQRLDVQVVASI